MSIFDDLTKDSFLSKRATNRQSGANRADAEVASDLAAGRDDTEAGSDFSTKADTVSASDVSSRNRDDSYTASKNMTDTGIDTGKVAKNMISEDYHPVADTKKDTDTELSSDIADADRYDAEAASDMGYGAGSQYGTQTYSHAGVAFNKISDGEAKINYAGLLSKDGASEVIGIYGYGSNQNWENVSQISLAKDYSGSFTATIPIMSGKNINFAFRDSAQNWDNNAGLNYTFVN